MIVGRKLLVAAIAAALLCSLLVAALLGGIERFPDDQDCLSVDSTASTDIGLTVKGEPMSELQLLNAVAVVGKVIERDLPIRAAEIAWMTATQESVGGEEMSATDGSSSYGLYHQIDDWGPRSVRGDSVEATEMFLMGGQKGQSGLTDIDGWEAMPRGEAAQAVQRSAYPTAYTQWEAEAISTVAALSGEEALVTGCEEQLDPLELAVRAALKMIGQSYIWKSDGEVPYDGAGFVAEAFEAAGVDLPGSIEGLVAYTGETGVEETFIPASDFADGTDRLTRGDILLMSEDGKGGRRDATSAGVYVGNSVLDPVRIATYNVLGASHTPSTGPESWRNRIKKSADLIRNGSFTVIGLQELEPVQRTRLMELLGDDWGISPDQATFGNSPEVDARNSIIWDKRLVEAIDQSNLDMPAYFDGNRKQIPLVRFQMVESGELFNVANTHDPAKKQYAEQRLLNAQQHAADADRLVAEGIPLFFTGDFNSGFAVRSEGNTTFNGERRNLTWCVMTESGTMVNGYDASRPEPRLGQCPEATTDEQGVGPVDHVYVSKDVPVTGYSVLRGRAITGSDHPVVFINAGAEDLTGPGADSFQIATYNIKTGNGFETRVQRARELTEQFGWDIVGFQEVELAPIFSALKEAFSDTKWAVYPTKIGEVYRNGLQARAIVYNTDRFTLEGTDEIQFRRMEQDGDPQPARAPVIRLRDRVTGQEFYVANTHTSAFRRYALERKEAGEAYASKIRELKADGLPVFFTGDFNSGFWVDQDGFLPTWQADRNNLTYCQLTDDGLMQNAKDVREGIAGRNNGYCPRRRGEGEWMIDHIYVTPGVRVNDFDTVSRAVNLSDHATVYARVRIPGSDAAENGAEADTGQYVGPNPKTGLIELMPVPMDRLVGVIRLEIDPAVVGGGTWRFPMDDGVSAYSSAYGWRDGQYHNGSDFSTYGETPPLYAMHDGEVVVSGYDEAWGNYIVVETGVPVPPAPGQSGATYKYLYAHLSSIADGADLGDVVKVGQVVGNVGTTGRSTGEHLHLNICTDMVCTYGSSALERGTEDPIVFMRRMGIRFPA